MESTGSAYSLLILALRLRILCEMLAETGGGYKVFITNSRWFSLRRNVVSWSRLAFNVRGT